jgi:hypothetical protein
MTSLIKIQCKDSTEKNPCAFFENFYSQNKFSEAKAAFISIMPNPNDPNDFWNSYACNIDKKKETFSVEYYEEEYNEEGLIINLLSKINIYSFEAELEKLFEEQFKISTRLLHNKIDKIRTKELSKKTVAEYLSEKTRFFLNAIDDIQRNVKPKKLHKIYTRPFKSLVVFLYRYFSDLMPNQHCDHRISVILKESPKSIELYKPANLSVEIIDSIIRLKDSKNVPVFPFHDPKLVSENLLHFYNRQPELIKSQIWFSTNIGAANYLIAKLAYYWGFTRPIIEDANIFKLGQSKFIADLCDREYYRFGSANSSLKDSIDFMLDRHLS